MDEDLCSCDANDAIQRTDAGFVRDQSALPIREVRVGDVVDAADSALVDIGHLECEAEGEGACDMCFCVFILHVRLY